MTLKQKIIELVRFSATKSVGDVGFSSSHISIGTGGLISIKCVSELTKYVSQLVVATTHWNGTRDMLTSAKLLTSYLVVEITRELDKEPLLY